MPINVVWFVDTAKRYLVANFNKGKEIYISAGHFMVMDKNVAAAADCDQLKTLRKIYQRLKLTGKPLV